MSRAVAMKTARDALLLALFLTLWVVFLEFAIVRMIIEISKDLEHFRTWLSIPLVQDLLRMALGADVLGDLSPTALSTIGLGHPLLYVLSWTLLVTIGTGVLSGEMDRGTADLLLALPLSRTKVYVSTTVVWLVTALVVSAAPLLGLRIGQAVWTNAPTMDYVRLVRVCGNLCALNLSVGAVTMLVSSLVPRRGRAVGVVLCGLFGSDLINVLSQFWPAIRPFSFLGFLHYYKPLAVVRQAAWPMQDMAALLVVGVVAWTVGWWHFARRDIPAV